MSLAAVGMRGAILPALAMTGVLALAAGCTSSHSSASHTSTPTAASSTSAGTTPASASAPASSAPSTAASSPSQPVPASSSSRTSAPVPAPSGGTIHSVVPSQVVTTEPAVPVGHAGSFRDGMTVTATAVRAITATAHGPGEIGGPAVEIFLKFANSGSRPVNLGVVTVNVTGTNGDPGSTISGAPAKAVSTTVAAHSSATGRYVFTLATSDRSHLTITVSYSNAPVVVIKADGSR